MSDASRSGEDAAGKGGRRDVTAQGLAAAGFRAAGPDDLHPFEPHTVEKPWGHELIWAHTEEYVGKLLVVKAGEALSLQFHEEKDETLHLLSGTLKLEVGPGVDALAECPLAQGQSIRLVPGTLHRMEAVTDCQILEASTSQLDDVVRIRDRYGRVGAEGDAEQG